MATISDLQVRIGADSSGFRKEINKIPKDVKNAFNTNPVKEMQNALEGTTNSLNGLISKYSAFAAAAAGGFGLINIVKSAVSAGNSVYELSEKLGITTKQAGEFSKILKFTGADVDTASTAFMKLDKTLSSGGESGEKVKAMLNAVGVSLTDSNGKLLPLNEQLAQLATGYQRAAQAGYSQEFIMDTLGARGLSLVNTLREYSEAKNKASKIQGIGLNIEQMHQISDEMELVQAQLGQLGLASGAALAPIAQEFLPPILSGLAETAKFIAENKTQIAELSKVLLVLIGTYKTLQVVKTAAMAAGSLATLATGVGQNVSDDALTRQQEASINRRIKAIEKAAMKEEAAYLKTLSTAKLSDAQKEASYTAYCVKRETEAARMAQAESARMTAMFKTINAQSTASANTQISNNARVALSSTQSATKQIAGTTAVATATKATTAVQATLTATTAATGLQATRTGGAMVGAATGAIGPLKAVASAVWALAGGWLGVAAAIGTAIYAAYEYYQTAEKNYKKHHYKIDGKTYGVDQNGNVTYLKDNGARKEVWDSDIRKRVLDMDAEQNAARKEYNEKYKTRNETPNGLFNANDIYKTQLDQLMKSNGGLDVSTKENTKAIKDATAKMTEINVPVGQNALDIAESHVGEMWEGALGNSVDGFCADFVSSMYEAAGIGTSRTGSGYNLDEQFKNAGAWRNPESYAPKAGDYLSWAGHVGISDGNGGYIARNSQGGVHHGSMAEASDWFGPLIGIGDVGAFTGGKTVKKMVDANGKSIQDAINKLNQAKEQAVSLFQSMQTAIDGETESAYASGMNRLADDVQKKAETINQIMAAGVDDETINNLKAKLAEYSAVMQQKLVDENKQAMNKLKSETIQATAEATGNYKEMADAQYQATVDGLEKEREERLKEVQKNKDDKEAMVAVEQWYTAQVQKAAQERAEAYRDSYNKQLQYAIENHNTGMIGGLLGSEEGQQAMDWEGQTTAFQEYVKLWNDGHKSMEERTAELADTSKEKFTDFFNSILTGAETFGNAFSDLILGIGESILNQLSEMLANRLATSIFGGLLGMGGNGNSGVEAGGLPVMSYVGGLNGGLSFGGGESDNPFGSFTNGLNAATNAVGQFGTKNTEGSKYMGLFNVAQNLINTTTKPAEVASTASATAAMGALTSAAFSASVALKTVGASKFGFFATGGAISGPGTGTSDSIPAWLSNGEFVVSAKAVESVGLPLLNAINEGHMPRFATGGSVPSKNIRINTVPASNGNGGTVNLSINAIDASSFGDFMDNGGLDEIRQKLFENNRNFASESGVW